MNYVFNLFQLYVIKSQVTVEWRDALQNGHFVPGYAKVTTSPTKN